MFQRTITHFPSPESSKLELASRTFFLLGPKIRVPKLQAAELRRRPVQPQRAANLRHSLAFRRRFECNPGSAVTTCGQAKAMILDEPSDKSMSSPGA
jgi:hypothetical protein